MRVEAFDTQGALVTRFERELLLLAFGISGYRTYGAVIPILPEAHMLTVAKLVIRYSEPILAQMDGEPVLLDREDFPISLELTRPCIPNCRFIH